MRYLLAILTLLAAPAFAADMALTWTPPTQNVDGSQLNDLTSYNVYIGTNPSGYTITVPINDPTLSTAVVPFVLAGLQNQDTVYVALTAVNSTGQESAFSNEVSKVVTIISPQPSTPNAPVIITITIDLDCPQGYSCSTN